MGKIPVCGFFLAMGFLALTVKGEIRCYCNKVDCVPTGYMCKSQLGICYSLVKFKDSNMGSADSSIVHGCADTLEQEPRIRTCAGHPVHHNEAEINENGTESQTVTNSIEQQQPEPFLVQNGDADKISDYSNSVDPSEPHLTCCTQDMCNYKDSLDIQFQVSIGSHSNERKVLNNDRGDETDKPHKDLWFKAAVIAVPIAGGFILILLVLLAVRMLRSDSRHHRRLIQIRRERSLTKAQLYVTDHFIDKDKHNNKYISDNQSGSPNNHVHSHSQQHPKCDHSHSHSHSHVTSNRNSNSHHQHHSHQHHQQQQQQNQQQQQQQPQQQQSRHHHHHHNRHHHKNNNCPKVTTNKDGHTYEQIVTQTNDVNSNNSCDSTCQTSYPSIVVWGQPPQQDVAAVV